MFGLNNNWTSWPCFYALSCCHMIGWLDIGMKTCVRTAPPNNVATDYHHLNYKGPITLLVFNRSKAKGLNSILSYITYCQSICFPWAGSNWLMFYFLLPNSIRLQVLQSVKISKNQQKRKGVLVTSRDCTESVGVKPVKGGLKGGRKVLSFLREGHKHTAPSSISTEEVSPLIWNLGKVYINNSGKTFNEEHTKGFNRTHCTHTQVTEVGVYSLWWMGTAVA